MIISKSPYNLEIFQEYEALTARQIDHKLTLAANQYKVYRTTSFLQRSTWLQNAAVILENKKQHFAEIITREMGKLLTESLAEVEKCAWVCRYYAENADTFLRDQTIATDAARSYISYQPLGPVLAIMPWNFPFWQVFRFAAPAVMVGNTGLLKHASNVPQCALAIEGIFTEAGFPPGTFTTLLVTSDQVGPLIGDRRVKAVTLTGSEPAGASVAALAGKSIKKTVLELGGSDPYVILEDARLDKAVPVCVQGRMLNAGQSCIAAKRFIIHQSHYSSFVNDFKEKMRDYHFGDPMQRETRLAPLCSTRQRDELHQQVMKAQSQGARILCGGHIPEELPGAFYPPTILTDVGPDNVAYSDEFFGPVAICFKADSEEEAIHIANDTSFGLGAAVFSEDVARAEEIARTKLEAGCCFVNGMVKSDPRLPFGGIKNSGYGRELSLAGIHEFTNMKTVYVNG